jgi:hypothetical protein
VPWLPLWFLFLTAQRNKRRRRTRCASGAPAVQALWCPAVRLGGVGGRLQVTVDRAFVAEKLVMQPCCPDSTVDPVGVLSPAVNNTAIC